MKEKQDVTMENVTTEAAQVHTLDGAGNAWFAGDVSAGADHNPLAMANLTNVGNATFKAKADEAGVGGGGVRTCRFVIGTSTAGWTAADCDYLCDGVDDQVEIQAAIDALPDGGGEIVILGGTYNTTNEIIINRDNVALIGNGNATVLKRITIDNEDDEATLIKIDNGKNNIIKRLTIDGYSLGDGRYTGGIAILNNSSKNIITENIVLNNKGSDIMIKNSSNNIIEKNLCYRNLDPFRGYNIQVYLSEDNIIANNIIEGAAVGIALEAKSKTNNISGNSCINNTMYGICSYYASLNTISNNTVKNCSGVAIDIKGVSEKNIIIGNNCIKGSGVSSDYDSTQYTILLEVSVKFNLISNNIIMGKNYVDKSTNSTNEFIGNKFE
ncbi:MAG: right-handed parallel beta-helix repeat-containing protein [Peptococcaceae bacterium]|nr:right-handed parallel beta-helix repeat-containing protein [Peptococcaceae bacterium]